MAVIAGTESLEAPLDHPREQGEDRTNLIINYLPQAMTDNELYSMFITVGQIVSAKIMRDKSSGYSYGYGFVHYQLPEDAAKAIATLNGLQVSNKRIKVSYSRPNTADIKDTNLYVGNVPQGVSEEELGRLFSQHGNLLTKKLLRDQGGKNKGIAFVRFSKKSEADTAIAHLHGHFFPGASRGLEVKVAEDHGRQKAAFYAGWMHGQGGGEEDFGNYGSGPGFGRGGRGGGGYRGRGGGGGGGADFGVGGEYDQGFQGFQGLQQFPAPGGAMRGMGGNRYNPLSRGNAAGPKFPSNNSGGGASWAPPLPHGRAKGQGPFPRGGGAGPRGAFNRGGGGGMGMGGPMGRGSRGGFQGYEPWS